MQESSTRKRVPAFLRAQTDGLFVPFEAYLRQELPLHSQKSHPVLLTFLGLRINLMKRRKIPAIVDCKKPDEAGDGNAGKSGGNDIGPQAE